MCSLADIDNYINEIIIQNQYNVENYEKVLEENKQLKTQAFDLKETIENLTKENTELMAQVGKYKPTISKDEKKILRGYSGNAPLKYYLYAFQTNQKYRFKCGICRVPNFEARELMHKKSDENGSVEYKVQVTNGFTEKMMHFMLKEYLNFVEDGIFEGDLGDIKVILDTIQKFEKVLFEKNVLKINNALDHVINNKKENADGDTKKSTDRRAPRSIDQIDKNTKKLIATFPTFVACGKALGVTGEGVSIALRQKRPIKGYIFRYTGVTEEQQYEDQPVIKTNCCTGKKTNFPNIASAALDAGVSSPALRNRINTSLHVNNHNWTWHPNATHWQS